MKLCFATNNKNKIEEVSKLLNKSLLSLEDIGCNVDIPETSETIGGNSMQKARYVWDNFKVCNFADDTGLEIESLDNEPGVLSARYAGEQKNSSDNINLVLSKLKNTKNRNARFRTVITLILSDDEIYQFEGEVEGKIIEELKGEKGFGYDPIFVPNGYDKTFAEFSLKEKNKISHRGIAVRKLVSFLNSKINE